MGHAWDHAFEAFSWRLGGDVDFLSVLIIFDWEGVEHGAVPCGVDSFDTVCEGWVRGEVASEHGGLGECAAEEHVGGFLCSWVADS